MGYFLNWLFLLFCLLLGRSIAFSQSVDTLKSCSKHEIEGLTIPENNLILKKSIDEKIENRQRFEGRYELPQKMYKNVYSKGHKDVYVDLCLNGQWITESDSSACGDLGRVKARRGSLQFEFDRFKVEDSQFAHLYAISIEDKKPPVKRWVLRSFLSPHWGHKQIEAFNKPEDAATSQTPIDTSSTISLKNIKQKKRKTASVIGGLLVIGGITKLLSMGDYETAKRHYKKGELDNGRFYYEKANRRHRTALIFVGTALLVDLGNVISVFSKGNKKMRTYHQDYPKGQKCPNW